MRGSAAYVIGRLRGEFRPASTVLRKGISVIASQSAGQIHTGQGHHLCPGLGAATSGLLNEHHQTSQMGQRRTSQD